LLLLCADDAKQVERVRLIWVNLEDATECSFRFRQSVPCNLLLCKTQVLILRAHGHILH
jgi:hypothetical protein